jgi:glucokinase
MGATVAVDLGATTTRVAIVREGGEVGTKREAPTPAKETDPSRLVSFLSGLVGAITLEMTPGLITGIGLSVAGPVDIARGVLVNPPNMACRDVPLTIPLSRIFHCPVRMVNDCHAGVLGEMYYGQGKGHGNVVYLTISTGIGGGVVAGGQVLLGRAGNAAEVGHFHVDSTYDLACGCGHTGHWEGYASGRYLPWFFGEWCRYHAKPHWGPDNARDLFASARQGDDDVLRFIGELARINARGISDVIVAYDPELIILDGSVIRQNADLLLPSIMKSIDRYLPLPEIVISSLEGDAPLLGAAVIGRGYETVYGDFGSVTEKQQKQDEQWSCCRHSI